MDKPDTDCNDHLYNVGYAEGYQDGLNRVQRDDDAAFWLRQYAGMAMQGMVVGVDNPDFESVAYCAVRQAYALMEEVKKREAENDSRKRRCRMNK